MINIAFMIVCLKIRKVFDKKNNSAHFVFWVVVYQFLFLKLDKSCMTICIFSSMFAMF